MKNRLKLTLAAAIAAACVFALFGCNNDNSGVYEMNEPNNISLVSRNKEKAHTKLIPYNSIDEAVKSNADSSGHFMSLNGEWSFRFLNSSDSDAYVNFAKDTYDVGSWDKIQVPSNWQTKGYSLPTYAHDNYPWNTVGLNPPDLPTSEIDEVALYRRTVELPTNWDGQEVYISFEGVESACYVYVNGSLVGYGEDSYTTKDFRITPYLQFGKPNTIAVKVFKYCDASWLEAQDSLKMGGIYRDVYLYSTPKTSIKDIYVKSTVSKKDGSVALKIDADVAAYGNLPNNHYMTVSVYDQDGNCVADESKLSAGISFNNEKTGGAYNAEVSGRTSLASFVPWSAENPYRYTFVFTIKDGNDNVITAVSYKYGIRDIGFSTDAEGNKTFVINGQPLTLYGVVYYEHSAVNGKAVTKEEMIADIKTMKELNINAVRSPGQPLSPTFIELCDEYGLYVVSDLNLETDPWSTKGAQSIPGDQNIWQTALLDRLSNVLERDKNSASVIIWALGNQSGSGTVLTSVKNWLISNESRMILYDAYLTVEDTDDFVQDDTNVTPVNNNYDTPADLIAASGWDLDKLNDVANNPEITKPIIIQDFDMGLLSSGGSIDSYINIIKSHSNIMGGFFANWADMAIYVPKDSANKVETIQNNPYETNPDLYELQYAASWGDYENDSDAVKTSKYSLNGLLNADRTMQSDAYEFKNAYASIYVSPIDIAVGKFQVSNRNCFTAFENNYLIEYEVFNGSQSIKKGMVEGLTLSPGESKEISIDYGTIGTAEYYVSITVKYMNKPVWATDDYDLIVFDKQYDITGNTVPVKSGAETSTSGDAFTITEFVAPTIETMNSELAKGNVFVSNPMSSNFSDVFSLYYEVIETNTFWSSPKPIIYLSGTIENTGIGPYADGVILNLPLDVKAVEDGVYQVNIVLTTKYAIGDIPAGYSWRYVFTPATLGAEGIPFEIDYSRTPTAVYDDDGNQMRDENGNLMWEEGDPMPAVIDNPYHEPESENEIPTSFIELSNSRVHININPETGLITSFTVDGVDIFESTNEQNRGGPIGSLYRTPTGGDYVAGLAGSENGDALKKFGMDPTAMKLMHDVSLEKVASDHYRITLQYSLPSTDTSVASATSKNSMYTVVYDIYANGVLNVSCAFDLAAESGIPTQLANIMTLSGNLKDVSWYGRGPGETYSDKLYNSRIGQYSSSVDALSTEYLMPSGGDRSSTSWVSFTNNDGKGVVVTSDTSKFAFNVSKSYPWEDIRYSRDVLSRSGTVVNIIGMQRGANAGSAADQTYLLNNATIEAGTKYQFSYRIVPINNVSEAATRSAETLKSAGVANVSRLNITAGNSYALQSIFGDKQYVSTSSTGLSLASGYGNNHQIFKMDTANAAQSNGFLLQSLANNLYLTGVGISTDNKDSIEVGFAPYNKSATWQTWTKNNNELTAVGSGYSLTLASGSMDPGARLALMISMNLGTAAWTIEPDLDDETLVKIKNNASGLYLTVVDNLSYKNALLQALDQREFNNAPDTDWNVYSALGGIDNSRFIQTSGHITQWDLLPSDSQMWTFENAGNGLYRIKNNANGTYLGIREVQNSVTKVITKTLVEFNANNVDEDPASIIWAIRDVGGLASIINTDYNLALEAQLVRTKMTDEEKLRANITDDELAFKNVYVLGINSWKNASSQKWNLKSNENLQVNVQAQADWFKNAGIDKK